MNPPKYEIHHLEHCNSQYFGGHHLPVFQIMVDGNTTLAQIQDEMLDWQTTDHIEDIDRDEFEKAVDVLFSANPDLSIKYDAHLDILDEDDYDYDCYVFFALETLGEDDE